MTLAHLICQLARSYAGLYEVSQNAKWDDPQTAGPDAIAADLVTLLRTGGWEPGAPYCMSFCKGVWLTAYRGLGASQTCIDALTDMLTPSVMQTFKRAKGFVTAAPSPGAIFLMQRGDTGFGHAGIVIAVNEDKITTVEGNTSAVKSDAAHDRDGDGIFRRVRKVSFTRGPGLWLRGFLPPRPIQ